MTPPSMYHWSAIPPFFCNACRRSRAPVSFSGWKFAASCYKAAWSAWSRCVLPQSHPRQPKEGCPPLAVRQHFLAPLLPTCPRPGCTLGSHQRLPALHLDPSALAGDLPVQPRTSSDVSTLLLLCALGETVTPTHRLPLDHPNAIFLIDFDSGRRFTE